MAVLPPGTAATKSSDAPTLQKIWQKTLDAHIARILERSGYPQQVAASLSVEPPPVAAPKRGAEITGAPSAAARTQGTKAASDPTAATLALMQKMASESLLVRAKIRLTAQLRRNDLIMTLSSREPWDSPCGHVRVS